MKTPSFIKMMMGSILFKKMMKCSWINKDMGLINNKRDLICNNSNIFHFKMIYFVGTIQSPSVE